VQGTILPKRNFVACLSHCDAVAHLRPCACTQRKTMKSFRGFFFLCAFGMSDTLVLFVAFHARNQHAVMKRCKCHLLRLLGQKFS